MSPLQVGLVFGLDQGTNFGLDFGVVAETIYDQNSTADINSFIQDYLSSAEDFTPSEWYTCDDLVGGFIGSESSNPLKSTGSAVDTSSPHGRAVVNDGATKYWITDGGAAGDYVLGTQAFAFAIRIKFTGANPAGTEYFLSKGATAGTYYAMGINSSGHPVMSMKGAGAAATATAAVDIVDGEWHWILGGRSVDNEVAWIAVTSVDSTTAFSQTKDIVDITTEFGVWDSTAGDGGLPCQVDQLIVWKNAPAQNVFVNQEFLLFEDTPA